MFWINRRMASYHTVFKVILLLKINNHFKNPYWISWTMHHHNTENSVLHHVADYITLILLLSKVWECRTFTLLEYFYSGTDT